MNSKRRRIARLIHSRPAASEAAAAPHVAETITQPATAVPSEPIGMAMVSEVVVDVSDELESGIAEVFAAMRATVESDEAGADVPPVMDRETIVARDLTFQLLSELDRLWEQAA